VKEWEEKVSARKSQLIKSLLSIILMTNIYFFSISLNGLGNVFLLMQSSYGLESLTLVLAWTLRTFRILVSWRDWYSFYNIWRVEISTTILLSLFFNFRNWSSILHNLLMKLICVLDSHLNKLIRNFCLILTMMFQEIWKI
jgi:hypothetical protein